MMHKDQMQCAYSKLARIAAQAGERLWALRPKMHETKAACWKYF